MTLGSFHFEPERGSGTLPLFVHTAGKVGAPTILFLHGGGLSGEMWLPQIEALSDRFHCLAPDLPEQGQSHAVGPFTLEGSAATVAALVRRHAADGRAHVVGLSLGGAVALTLMRLAPECVERVVLSGTPARFGRLEQLIVRWSTPLYRLFPITALASLMSKQLEIPATYEELIHKNFVYGLRSEFARHYSDALATLQLPRGSGAPTLVAVGSKETALAKRGARMIAAALPNAQSVEVPGATHVWNLQRPALFTAMVRAWIQFEVLPPALAPRTER